MATRAVWVGRYYFACDKSVVFRDYRWPEHSDYPAYFNFAPLVPITITMPVSGTPVVEAPAVNRPQGISVSRGANGRLRLDMAPDVREYDLTVSTLTGKVISRFQSTGAGRRIGDLQLTNGTAVITGRVGNCPINQLLY